MRDPQLSAVIAWGTSDLFFTPEGWRAYLRDLPDAKLHMLDAGHFALEDHSAEIATLISRFYTERVSGRQGSAA